MLLIQNYYGEYIYRLYKSVFLNGVNTYIFDSELEYTLAIHSTSLIDSFIQCRSDILDYTCPTYLSGFFFTSFAYGL